MKLFFPVLLIIAGLAGLGLQAINSIETRHSAQWLQGTSGYVQALQMQQDTQRPVLLFFYTDWCPNCRRLRETILNSDKFIAYADQLIAVKINPEENALNQQLADSYRVIGYPTLLLFKSADDTPHSLPPAYAEPGALIRRIEALLHS